MCSVKLFAYVNNVIIDICVCGIYVCVSSIYKRSSTSLF